MTAQEFRNWRLGMDWSVASAARALGVSPATIKNYERGHRAGAGSHMPVEIPQYIELACSKLSEESHGI